MRPMQRLLAISSLTALVGLSGCISQWNTRMPRLHYESTQQQRRESQLQDPFPDDRSGPEMGFRPLGFETPRTEALQTKQQYRSTILKQQYGPPPGPQVGPGAQYPNAVQVN